MDKEQARRIELAIHSVATSIQSLTFLIFIIFTFRGCK